MSRTEELSPTYLRRLEPATCALCGSDRRTLRFREQPYAVVLCKTCGLTYVTPRLPASELVALVYDESYWRSPAARDRGYTDYVQDAELYLRTFELRAGLIERYFGAPGRVLDIGCAAGYFLRVAQDAGHDVHGVELSAAIAGEAELALGKERIHVGTLDDAVRAKRYAPQSFDLITMWDVVEHLPDPQHVLRTVRGLVKPGGKLLLETQNVASRWARWLGRRWHHYKHDEHLYHFSPATIVRLLGDCGFRPVQIGAAYAGKYVSFGFLAERAGRLGRIAGLLAKPLALLRPCNLYVNPRDEIIVVAAPV